MYNDACKATTRQEEIMNIAITMGDDVTPKHTNANVPRSLDLFGMLGTVLQNNFCRGTFQNVPESARRVLKTKIY